MSSVPTPAGERHGRPVLHLLLFAALAVFILLPFAQSLITSFISTMPRDGIKEGDVSLINFINIVQTPALRESILNSTFYDVPRAGINIGDGWPAEKYAQWLYDYAVESKKAYPGLKVCSCGMAGSKNILKKVQCKSFIGKCGKY